MRRLQPVGREGDGAGGGGEQEIVAGEELVDLLAVGEPPLPHHHELGDGDVLRRLHHRDQAGVHPVLPLRQVAQPAGEYGGPEEVEQRGAQLAPGRRQRRDRGAQGGEHVRGLLHQGRHVVVDAGVAEVGAVGDALALHGGGQVAGIVLRRCLQRQVVPRVRAGHRLEHQRAVGDGAAHRADMGGHVVVRHRPAGHPAMGGLHAEHAAHVGGDADRPGAVAALVQRAIPCRGPRPRAGGGAARAQAMAPGVVGDAGQRALADALPAELRRRRLAQHDAAGVEQPLHRRAGHVRHMAGEHVAAHLRRHALGLLQILDGDGHAFQLAGSAAGIGRLRLPGLGQGGLAGQRHDGVQRRLLRGDVAQGGGHDFHRAEGSGLVVRQQLGRGHEADIGVRHGASSAGGTRVWVAVAWAAMPSQP